MKKHKEPNPEKPIEQRMKDMARKEAHPAKGWSSLSLCLARILEIHWEEMRCTIEVLAGQGDYTHPYSGVELLMPSMGNRHFMGGIPEIGDQCVVGWFVGDPSGSANAKTPAILAWWPSATYLGHDWIPTQDFAPKEGLDGEANQDRVANLYKRIRNKLRHYEPGNIGASSSQGSDMVLDASVTLSNRRSNELILRDQDQAIILRSLQQFHALSGARVYAGMVQRDARSLPKEMFSDGIKWDSSVQLDAEGNPYYPFDPEFEQSEVGAYKLDPHPLFSRGDEATLSGNSISGDRAFSGNIPPDLDPYRFLYRAGLVSEDFYDNTQDALTYGGKSVFRVGTSFNDNAEVEGEAFTEYRIEVNHTSDGVLPVTEQTDGFDSDRLPDELGADKNTPFIEWVLGTPVGNDPFGTRSNLYGKPLVPSLTPEIGTLISADSDTAFADHSATLLRVTPIVPDLADSFATFTKGGKFKANISSPEEDSLEVRAEGGASLNVNGTLNLRSNRAVINNQSTEVVAQGAISLDARGAITGSPLVGDGQEVSVNIRGSRRIALQSATSISFNAPVVDFSQAGEIRLNSTNQMSLTTGSGLELSGQRMKQTATGSLDLTVSGPPDFNATHGAVRKTKIVASPVTGHPAGASDEYTNAYGGRSETFVGPATNTRTVATGTETKTIVAGTDTTLVSGNSQITDPTGIKITAPVGMVAITSGSAISLTSNAVVVKGASAVVISGASVVLGSPGTAFGSILCGSDIHPILGVPWQTLIPPRGQNLAVVP